MLTTREWLANELKCSGRTPADFFGECWTSIYGKPCRSNLISLDAAKYTNHNKIPLYVCSRFEALKKNAKPETYTEAYHNRVQPRSTLVSTGDPVLHAHKGKDGVWRC